jgi:NAD(P)H-hydrate epimerase
MLKIATAKEMQHIDRLTIEKYGIAGIVLMERAGLGVVSKINEIFYQNVDDQHLRKIVVLCGGGNNGGDGLVIARILHNQGRDVEVYLAAKPDSLTGDAKVNYDAAKKFGVKIYPLKKFLTDYPLRSVSKCIIVDALLGTGLSKEVRAPLSDIIDKVNKMIAAVVSVDIPSGISSDTGQILGCGVKAQYTVTFGLPKRGHLIYPGAELTGHLFIEEIGFPGTLLESEKIRTGLIQKEDICSLFPERLKYSHKGTYGHVLIVAGSKGKTGAALMAAKACLKSGAGLVTIGIPDTLVNTFQSRVTEEMILPLPDKGDGTLSFNAAGAISDFMGKDGNVLAMGPGMSVDREISNLVSLLIKESENPMVIDADGLNAIAGNTHILKKSRAPIVLTPHPGEMSRLLSKRAGWSNSSWPDRSMSPREDIEKDRINSAQKFARKNACYLVLKGVPTVIAVPDGKAFINPTGNPGMSTAGAGDVLTGMISAFLAQGLSPQDAAIAGVYMHGLTGDFIAEKAGKHSLIASDIINKIPKVFKSVLAR